MVFNALAVNDVAVDEYNHCNQRAINSTLLSAHVRLIVFAIAGFNKEIIGTNETTRNSTNQFSLNRRFKKVSKKFTSSNHFWHNKLSRNLLQYCNIAVLQCNAMSVHLISGKLITRSKWWHHLDEENRPPSLMIERWNGSLHFMTRNFHNRIFRYLDSSQKLRLCFNKNFF